jgi:hypothetical protein
MTELHYLNRKWDLWYHDPNNHSYTLDSYIKLGCIDTIESFWHYYYQLKLTQLQNGMFFLMSEGTLPTWEDNLEGGSWSFKIEKKDISQAWTKLSIHLLSDNFVEAAQDSPLHNQVTGIFISPKKTFTIFKLWIKDHKMKEAVKFKLDLPFLLTDESMYRSHQETKEKEQQIASSTKPSN